MSAVSAGTDPDMLTDEQIDNCSAPEVLRTAARAGSTASPPLRRMAREACAKAIDSLPQPDDPCSELGAFTDGELQPRRREAFRLHLASCAACQKRLPQTVQLVARLSEIPRRELIRLEVRDCVGCPFVNGDAEPWLCDVDGTEFRELGTGAEMHDGRPPPEWCPLRRTDKLVTLRLP